MAVDVKQLGRLLGRASISKEEKEAWRKLIPHMREKDLERLLNTLQNEQVSLAKLKNEYKEKMQKIIDERKAAKLSENIQDV